MTKAMNDEMDTPEGTDAPQPVKRAGKKAAKKTAAKKTTAKKTTAKKPAAKKKAAPKKKAAAKKTTAKKDDTQRGAPAKHPQGKPASATAYKKALKVANGLTRKSRASVSTVAFEAGFDDESTMGLVAEVVGTEATVESIAALRRKHFRELNKAA